MGVAGVAIANTSSAALNLLVQHILVHHVFSAQFVDLFKWPNKTTFNCDDCKKLLKSSLARILQNFLEYWTVPLLVVLAVSQGPTAQAAMILAISILSVFNSLG